MLLNCAIAQLVSRFSPEQPHSVIEMVDPTHISRGVGNAHELAV
jgi:hypothetical protein